MKICIETLGCKVNQFESQAMAALLQEAGHELVADAADCDVFLLNSCAVTAESGRKSRQALRRLRREAPGAVGVILGCYSQIQPEEAAQLGVQLVWGTGSHRELLDLLPELKAGDPPRILVDKAGERKRIESLPAGRVPGRTRALIRIQDGCNNFCSYCVIPYSRGRVRSMSMEDCVKEASRLAGEGFRELVITGIEIASYGRDLEGRPDLMDAVEAMAKAAPGARLHLGSLEPRIVTEDFAKRAAALPNLCPHFHLSLQSGCDRTLKAMRRRYSTEEFYAVTCRLRGAMPGCSVTTDLICGFPGETEEDFAETLRFIEKCAFSAMHVFPYSPRPGTPAASMPDQIDRAEKARRAARASAVAGKMHEAYLDSCIGRTLQVLFETQSGGCSHGHGENYCEVRVPGDIPRGIMTNVQITGKEDGILLGNLPL